MIGDRREPQQLRALQERALARHVADDVYPYSAFYRPRLDASGLGRKPSGRDVLTRLDPVRLDDVADPADLVLRPDESTIQRFAPPGLLLKIFWAKLRRQADRVNREVIEPSYKPLRWVVADGVPIGYTGADLARLGELGRHWLALAELGRYDVLVSILPAEPDVAYWELVEGCRTAAVTALFLSPAATASQVQAAAPTVIAGRPRDLERLLRSTAGGTLPGLHTLLATGEPLDERRRRVLGELAPGATVVGAWAPPGVRSLWVECRGGEAAHTMPDAEIVEVDDGELVWTGIGWRGSALLRLRTGVTGELRDGLCPVCGRTSPRVRATAREPGFAQLLDATPEVVGWQAELRRVDGDDELIVHLAIDGPGHPGRVLRALDRELSVTQFVVLSPEELEQRLNATGYRRVLDRRAGG